MRLLVLGDTHGNTGHLVNNVFPLVPQLGIDVIVQVGDFGYWEHTDDGVEFLNACERLCAEYDVNLYWLHGNHDKHSLTLALYGSLRTDDGFIPCRSRVFYIPQGHAWTWKGYRLRAFGGAYSIDKQWRLEIEGKRAYKFNYGRTSGEPVIVTAETLWFPEEQMTDAEMDDLLAADSGPVDIVFSHDFPARANPGPHFKTLPECLPNQQRLQRAMDAHKPAFWFHGHLHHHYTDHVLHGSDDPNVAAVTTVVGLGCDPAAAGRFYKPWHSWALLDLDEAELKFTSGSQADEEMTPKKELDAA